MNDWPTTIATLPVVMSGMLKSQLVPTRYLKMNLSAWRVKPQEYVSNDQKESPPLRLNLKKMMILSSNAYTQATAGPPATKKL